MVFCVISSLPSHIN